jgi:FkbM family methyltransferase
MLSLRGGSAIGEDTVRIAEIVGPKGKVFAIEPDPVNLVFLKVNVRAFGNIEVIEKGVWNCRTELSFLRKGTLSGSISKFGGEKGGVIVKIDVDTIDNIVGDQKVDVLKLNVEGAEIEALEGAKHVLKTVREVLIAAHHIRNGEYTAERVVGILRSEGFHAEVVHGILAHHYVVARRERYNV